MDSGGCANSLASHRLSPTGGPSTHLPLLRSLRGQHADQLARIVDRQSRLPEDVPADAPTIYARQVAEAEAADDAEQHRGQFK